MAELTPITTQPSNSDQERLKDPEHEEKEIKRKKRSEWWQRICEPFNQCIENISDCLDFWCCQNECRNFCCDLCCKFNEDDLDIDSDPIYIDDAAMVTVSAENREENLPSESQQLHAGNNLESGNHNGTGGGDLCGGDGGGHDHSVGDAGGCDTGGGDSGGGDCGGSD